MKFEDLSGLYPKTEKLKSNENIEIRLMNADDSKILLEFFAAIPDEDKIFVRLNVDNEKGIRKWIGRIEDRRTVTLLAFLEGKLVGQASLHQDSFDCSHHVGHLRLRVIVQHRNKGIASFLSAHIYQIAQKTKLEKLCVEIHEGHEIACKIFIDKLGFKKEAVLKDYVIDKKGNTHNLVILTNDPEALLEELKQKLRFADLLYGQY